MPIDSQEATRRFQWRDGVNGLPPRATSVSNTPSPTRKPWSKGERRASAVLTTRPLNQMREGKFTRHDAGEQKILKRLNFALARRLVCSNIAARSFAGVAQW